MKTWEEIIQDLEENVESAHESSAYFGFEDAGYAYREVADLSAKMAILCNLLDEQGIPVPSVISPEPEHITDDIYIIETVWGWKVIPTPDGYHDGTGWRSFVVTIKTREDAIAYAHELTDVLENIEDIQKDAIAKAEAHIASKKEVDIVTLSFGSKQTSFSDWIKDMWKRLRYDKNKSC